jgi:hypothetical protein
MWFNSAPQPSWRKMAAAMIQQVIAENPGVTGPALKLLLRQHYPFGVRQYHPYKIWLNEVAKTLGEKPRKKPRSPRKPAREEEQPGQKELF